MYSINDGPEFGAVESIETRALDDNVRALRYTGDGERSENPRSDDIDGEGVGHVARSQYDERLIYVDGEPVRASAEKLKKYKEDKSLLEPPEEVIPGIAAIGRLSMLAAREKVGKTTLLAWCASQVALGNPIFGAEIVGGPVLWVGLEEALGDAVRRFDVMKADENLIEIVTDLPQLETVKQLTAEILYVRPRLVVIDSLAAYASSKEDENSATGWTQILQPVANLARKTKTAIVFIHHSSRASGAYRGSTAIGAAMDMIVEMYAEDGDDSVRRLDAKGRWKVETKVRVKYEMASESFSRVSTAEIQTQRVRDLETEICDAVRDLIQVSGRAMKEGIRAAVRGANSRIDSTLADLVASGKLVYLGNREGYKLPGHGRSPEGSGGAGGAPAE